MKTILALCLVLCAGLAMGGEPAAPAATAAAAVKGEVLEVKDVESYSYLRLKTKDGEVWAAVAKAPLKKGATVTIENPMTMTNFESKSLKRTFPTIVFGNLAGAAASPAAGSMANPHGGTAKLADIGDVHVPKASGADARTVAEIVAKSAELKDKTVVVRGKVVKYNGGIMGKNWVHLRDGSGAAADNSNDLLVTTANETQVGAVVVAKGIVRTDKDFGAGYAYKVLVEEATLQK
ncbi:MAG: hypothetical protein PHY45_04670 [Rhodocyclaceae bacterium]|nr:hypothetical protein [Rhodocyclaceae bacterium]